jgi:hypothetical protein
MNRKGQAAVESILILILFFAVTTLIAAGFKQNELFTQMVSAPWQNLSGMLQNGVWAPPSQGVSAHPSQHSRHISTRGENPR